MKKHLFFVCAMLTALLFASCEGNDPSNSGGGESHSQTGMYVGITGFSDNVVYYNGPALYYNGPAYRYNILTKDNSRDYVAFINSLSMGDATVLYYAVDNNLTYLAGCKFPEDLTSVNIITFTDGLNQGSRALDKKDGNHDYAASDNSYVAAISDKIKNTRVGGLPITAYAIGIRGNDVTGDATKTFSDNLTKLSSSAENAMEVSNMEEVNAKFKEIAESLYKKSESKDLTITIPMPSENEKERFTFDNVTDATASKCYLEGVYANGALTNIQYVGCMSNSGSEVKEEMAGGVKISFNFENFTDESGNAISTAKMQQWHMEEGQSTWTRNSEFKPTESIVVNEERKTAVVMLILDCSSSLGSDFSKVKAAANNFIKTLAGKNGTDPGTDPGTETTYYIKHPWGSGSDASWAWKAMTKVTDSYYEYTGLWGGVGAKINTTASDNGAEWFAESSISGSSNLSIGDQVTFSYYPVIGTLKVKKISGSSSSKTQVRFKKEKAYEYVLSMSVEKFEGEDWVGTEAEYEFGTDAGTSSYYDISSGVLYPMFYYDDGTDSGWYVALDSQSYNFAAGKKHTFICSDDGSYLKFSITIDGNANAPAKVVASKRIAKSELKNMRKVRRQ